MSDVRAPLVAALLAIPASAAAQSQAEWQARHERLVALHAEADRIADSVDSASRESFPMDTIRMGSLVVLAARSRSERARELMEHAWEPLAAIVGPDHPALTAHPIMVEFDNQPEGPMPPRVFGQYELGLTNVFTAQRMRFLARRSVGVVLSTSLAGPLTGWIPGLPIDVTTDEMPELYRTIVASGNSAARSCLTGEVPACVEVVRPDAEIADVPEGERRLTRSIRHSMLEFALVRGDSGALHRMTDSIPGDPLDALAAGARLDRADFIRQWQAELVARRPDPQRGFGLTLFATSLWIGGVAVLVSRRKR